MRKLLSADIPRLFGSKWFWLCMIGMLGMSVAFIIMQKSLMSHTVALSRVIFLPMSFFGLASAALVSLFVGEDLSDGFIRNKIVAGCLRQDIFVSHLIVSWLACILIYLTSVFFTAALGCFLFESDINYPFFSKYLLLGIGMCLAYGCIYCSITLLCSNKTTAVIICMGLAFFMLFACLHTNQVMVQAEYKDGIMNPAYVDGPAKMIYAILHDLNPTGQAAQLSAMKAFAPRRWLFCDFLWILAASIGGFIFQHKDIN